MDWNFNYIAITNNVEHAKILSDCGVQQLMVDVETLGKAERQHGKNMILSNHHISDVANLKRLSLNSEIICRINGYHHETANEIEEAIVNGADAIMIPMIVNMEEFQKMVKLIDRRCKIIPLVETSYSLFKLNEIIDEKNGITQIHIGLNDLCLSLGMKHLFEVLLSPIIKDVMQFATARLDTVGIGGIGNPNNIQAIDAKLLMKEFIRLKSTSVILSRSFFKTGYNQNDINKGLLKFEEFINEPCNDDNRELLKQEILNMELNK